MVPEPKPAAQAARRKTHVTIRFFVLRYRVLRPLFLRRGGHHLIIGFCTSGNGISFVQPGNAAILFIRIQSLHFLCKLKIDGEQPPCDVFIVEGGYIGYGRRAAWITYK